MESRVLRGRVSPRSKDKLFFKLFLLFSFSKDDGEIRRCARIWVPLFALDVWLGYVIILSLRSGLGERVCPPTLDNSNDFSAES